MAYYLFLFSYSYDGEQRCGSHCFEANCLYDAHAHVRFIELTNGYDNLYITNVIIEEIR